jgi:hypothetical protein
MSFSGPALPRAKKSSRGFLQLAKEGRIRLILDNASLHHQSKTKIKAKPAKGKKNKKAKSPPAEDQFEKLFLGTAVF